MHCGVKNIMTLRAGAYLLKILHEVLRLLTYLSHRENRALWRLCRGILTQIMLEVEDYILIHASSWTLHAAVGQMATDHTWAQTCL